MNKKILVSIVVLVALAIAVIVIQRSTKKALSPGTTTGQQSQGTTTQPVANVDVNPVESKTLPANLPTDLPWESGAEILQNFEATNKDTGQYQATRVYVSKKTLDQNMTIYKDYLTSHGWVIAGVIDQKEIKSLFATKDKEHLDIVLSHNGDGVDTVNVSYGTVPGK